MAVAAAAVRRDQQLSCMRETPLPHLVPPATDAVDGKLRRVVVDTDAHPPLVLQQIVHAVRRRLPQRLDQEVVNTHVFGLSLGKPLLPSVVEIPDLFLLFGVHRDCGLAAFDESLHAGVDKFKLGVAIRVRRPFPCLPVPLQAVAHLPLQPGQCKAAKKSRGKKNGGKEDESEERRKVNWLRTLRYFSLVICISFIFVTV